MIFSWQRLGRSGGRRLTAVAAARLKRSDIKNRDRARSLSMKAACFIARKNDVVDPWAAIYTALVSFIIHFS
jgi:hypothetical protein